MQNLQFPSGKPNRSPAQRVRFGKEEQRNERETAMVLKEKSSSQAIGSLRRRVIVDRFYCQCICRPFASFFVEKLLHSICYMRMLLYTDSSRAISNFQTKQLLYCDIININRNISLASVQIFFNSTQCSICVVPLSFEFW